MNLDDMTEKDKVYLYKSIGRPFKRMFSGMVGFVIIVAGFTLLRFSPAVAVAIIIGGFLLLW